jgi:hypothetical protein
MNDLPDGIALIISEDPYKLFKDKDIYLNDIIYQYECPLCGVGMEEVDYDKFDGYYCEKCNMLFSDFCCEKYNGGCDTSTFFPNIISSFEIEGQVFQGIPIFKSLNDVLKLKPVLTVECLCPGMCPFNECSSKGLGLHCCKTNFTENELNIRKDIQKLRNNLRAEKGKIWDNEIIPEIKANPKIEREWIGGRDSEHKRRNKVFEDIYKLEEDILWKSI